MSIIRRSVDMLIGEKLRELRESVNLTQEQLAEKLNSSSNYISNLEGGNRGLGPDMLRRYVDFFGLKEDELKKFIPAKKKGEKYSPYVQAIIDEVIEMTDSEVLRILADLKDAKNIARLKKDE